MAFLGELKKGNYVIDISQNKKIFDKIRKSLISKFSDLDSLEEHAEIDFTDNNAAKQVTQLIKVFNGRKSQNQYKRPLYTINFFLTKFKLMINGPYLHIFIDEILPEIKSMILDQEPQTRKNITNIELGHDHAVPEIEREIDGNNDDTENLGPRIDDIAQTSAAEEDSIDNIQESKAEEEQPSETDICGDQESDDDIKEDHQENKSKKNLNRSRTSSQDKEKEQTLDDESTMSAIQRIDENIAFILSQMVEVKNANKKMEAMLKQQEKIAAKVKLNTDKIKTQNTSIHKLDEKVTKNKEYTEKRMNAQSAAMDKMSAAINEIKVNGQKQAAVKETGSNNNSSMREFAEIMSVSIAENIGQLTATICSTLQERTEINQPPPTTTGTTQTITQPLPTTETTKATKPNAATPATLATQPQASILSAASSPEAGISSHNYQTVQGPKDPLSNFYSCKIESEYNKNPLVFNSAEQFYQYEKCLYFNDKDAARDILESTSPQTCKLIGDRVNRANKGRWESQNDTMMHILRKKARCCTSFSKKLSDSKDNIIYHAVRDRYWGIGQEVHEIQHPISNIIGENMFGRMLMSVRDHPLHADKHKAETTSQRQEAWRTAERPQHRARDGITERQTHRMEERQPQREEPTRGKSSERSTPRTTVREYRDNRSNYNHTDNYYNSNNHQNSIQIKPKVAIIGNTLLAGIKPRALSSRCYTNIYPAETTSDARVVISEMDKVPDIIGLQLIANEASNTSNPTKTAESCTSDIVDLVQEHPNTHFIICLTHAQEDVEDIRIVHEVVNSNLRFLLKNNNVDFINLFDLDQSFFTNEGTHLNDSGSSILASRYKRALHNIV